MLLDLLSNVSRLRKLTLAFATLLLLPVLLFNFPARAAVGDLDPSFDSDGKLELTDPHEFYDVVVQPDGKILALGRTRTGPIGTSQPPNYPSTLTRLEPDGTIDSSFGGGRIRPQVGVNITERSSFALQADGKIVLAGLFKQSAGSPYTLAVFRYLANGQLDAGYGNGGIVTITQNGLQSITDALIQPDGKLLISGYLVTGAAGSCAVWRFNQDGTLDAGFGTGGIVTPGVEQALNLTPYTLLVQTGGKILIVGAANNGGGFMVLRYNPNGTLDTSFGDGGKVATLILSSASPQDAALQADGKIVLAGYAYDGAVSRFRIALVRYTPDGALDASFGTGGKVITAYDEGQYSAANGVVIQPNGKIIVCGYTNLPQFEGAQLLARYNQSGALDTTFGSGGFVLMRFNEAERYAVALAMAFQPDGKLVVAGESRWDKYLTAATLTRHLVNGAGNYDFDRDGKADVSIFRPNASAEWYWLNSSTNQSGGTQFGIGTDKAVPADYDGDGRTDIAVFRDGDWYRLNSSNNSFVAVHFGQSADVPVPADYDGDSKADLAVYRAGNWYILNSADNSFRADQFGISTDKPVIGDFDGDGKTDLAVYRDGIWYQMRSSQGFYGEQFGISTDKALPADYDGDGKTDLAVYRPADGVWYLLRSGAGFTGIQFGISTDKPVPADYDGDGKTDIAVFRDGNWYLLQSTAGFRAVQFGSSTDVPIPNAFVP